MPVFLRSTIQTGELTTPTTKITGITRGMVIWAAIEPAETKGSEEYKGRCWVVVSTDNIHCNLPILLAIPLTSQGTIGEFRRHRIRILDADLRPVEGAGPHARLTGGLRECIALTDQLRVLAHERVDGDPVGKLTKRAMFALEAAMKYALEIP